MRILRLSAVLAVIAALSPVAFGQNVEQGTLRGNGTTCNTPGAGAVVLPLPNLMAGAAIQIDATFSGTVEFYGTTNAGVWRVINGNPQGGGAAVTSATAAGAWQFGPAGLVGLCAFMSNYVSGAAQITIRATNGVPPTGGGSVSGTVTADQGTPNSDANAWPIKIVGVSSTPCPSTLPCSFQGAVNDGSSGASVKPVVIGGIDGSSNVQNWLCDTAGICAVNMYVGGAAVTAVTDQCDGAAKSVKRYISAGSSDDESEVKATAGTLCGILARNANTTTPAYIKCTNLTAANTTPGSSAVYFDMIVPANTGGGGFVSQVINAPFSVALTCYIVTGKTDADATEVTASDVSYFLTYI